MLQSGEPVLLRISPDQVGDGDIVEGAVVVGNPCLSGGELEIFLEPRRPAPRVVVLGDTPIGRSLVLLGQDLGYDMEPAGAGGAGGVEEVADAAAVVVASHGRDEEPVLPAALRAGVPYVALVASRKRAAGVLAALDVTPGQRASVRSPAGLDIGAQTAGEVALSILAEVVASVRSQVASAGGRAAAAGGPAATAGGSQGAAGSRPADGGPAGPDGARADGISLTPKEDRFKAVFAVDPICGMTVAAVDSSIHSDAGCERHWFCCEGCKVAFEAKHLVPRGS